MIRTVFILLFVISHQLCGFAQTHTTGIELLKKTVIGGEGGWDYVSVSTEDRRLYVSHNNQVEVLNADTHEKIGVIPTRGVHGICAIQSLGKGFITNGKANNVTVFDIKTLQPLAQIATDEDPDALLYDQYSNRVFIFNNDGMSITVIDALSNKVIKMFKVGGKPETGVTDEAGSIYVNLEDVNEIVVFDSKTLVIKNRFKLSPGEEPTGLAYDKETHRLFSTCRKSQLMMVMDASNGKVIARLPIGKMTDGAIFNGQSKLVACSNGEGTITIVKEWAPDKFEVVDTIVTARGAKTLAFDSKTEHLYTVTAQLGNTPAPTAANPKPRPAIIPGTFMLLEYGKK
jgi:DNA-binding beta-propeller fold protein YncE